jgi:guanylate kinase
MSTPRGPLLIVSGASGSGKSTLIAGLLADPPAPLRLSVSATTRGKRPNEQDGVHYHFWDRARFEEHLRAGEFLEWAEVYGNYYGTLRSEVEPFRVKGVCVLLDVDTQGAAQVWKLCPDAVGVFIRTATLEELERRLRARGTETEESLARRLAGARRELEHIDWYHDQVINEDLNVAQAGFRAIVGREMERSKSANAG